jgi:hypothetical protein
MSDNKTYTDQQVIGLLKAILRESDTLTMMQDHDIMHCKYTVNELARLICGMLAQYHDERKDYDKRVYELAAKERGLRQGTLGYLEPRNVVTAPPAERERILLRYNEYLAAKRTATGVKSGEESATPPDDTMQ